MAGFCLVETIEILKKVREKHTITHYYSEIDQTLSELAPSYKESVDNIRSEINRILGS